MAYFKLIETATETWTYYIEADSIEQAVEKFYNEHPDPDDYTTSSGDESQSLTCEVERKEQSKTNLNNLNKI